MTVGVAWIKQTERGQELWLASDSRLGGDGNVWDDCPKLFISPRRDLAAAFSGDTAQAYPLLLQIANAIHAYQPATDGSLELTELIGHLERLANGMLGRIAPDPGVHGAGSPDPFVTRGDAIILGGYSRHLNGLVLRALQFDVRLNRWKFVKARSRKKVGANKIFRVFGDRVAAARYAHLLLRKLDDVGKLGNSRQFALEPMEALWDFLSLPLSDDRPLPIATRPATVSGPPQALVVRSGGSATGVAVDWAYADGLGKSILGRRLLHGERLTVPLLHQENTRLVLEAPGQW